MSAPGGERLARHAGGAVALAFLACGLATLGDWGITWDEPESYRAGVENLRLVGAALRGAPLPPWPWHELPGYQFAFDTLRAGFAELANGLLWRPGSYLGFHLANLLLTTAAVVLLAVLARREGGPLLGVLAATLLVVQPKLVAHSQANPKDVIALLVWVLALLALSEAARRRRARDFVLLGAAAGLAAASHVTAVLLAPLALVWVLAAAWRARTHPRDRATPDRAPLARAIAGLLVTGATAAATTLLLWPWLWAAPWQRALGLVRHVERFDVAMRVLYLGRLYHPTALPWHYGLVSLLVATPLPLLLLALLGVARASVTKTGGGGDGVARAGRLAALWLLLLLAADARAPARYDGARHLLPALPALALLAAVGAHALLGWALRARASGRRVAAAAAPAALAAALMALAVQLAAIHPYEDAFLAQPARLWLAPEAQHRLELEYWGNSYREAAAWIRAHTAPDTLVLVPMGPQAMEPFLAGARTLVPQDGSRDATRPQVLVLMTREAWYTPRARAVVGAERPLFVVRRQGSTLLAVYRVPAVPPAPAPPSPPALRRIG